MKRSRSMVRPDDAAEAIARQFVSAHSDESVSALVAALIGAGLPAWFAAEIVPQTRRAA